jgi:hypothetical protein
MLCRFEMAICWLPLTFVQRHRQAATTAELNPTVDNGGPARWSSPQSGQWSPWERQHGEPSRGVRLPEHESDEKTRRRAAGSIRHGRSRSQRSWQLDPGESPCRRTSSLDAPYNPPHQGCGIRTIAVRSGRGGDAAGEACRPPFSPSGCCRPTPSPTTPLFPLSPRLPREEQPRACRCWRRIWPPPRPPLLLPLDWRPSGGTAAATGGEASAVRGRRAWGNAGGG